MDNLILLKTFNQFLLGFLVRLDLLLDLLLLRPHLLILLALLHNLLICFVTITSLFQAGLLDLVNFVAENLFIKRFFLHKDLLVFLTDLHNFEVLELGAAKVADAVENVILFVEL